MADIIVEGKARKQYDIPSEGMHQAVLLEVNDVGLKPRTFNGVTEQVPTVQFVWQVAETDKEGQRKIVFESFRKSLSDKANLRNRIKDIFGKEPPLTLNISKLVGSNAQLLISHATSKNSMDGIKYANVKAVLKHDPAKLKMEGVARKKDAAPSASGVFSTAVSASNPINDEDVPF